MRSHPPTLLKLVERTLRDECRIERGTRILIAVSGGGDSSALLHALAKLAPRFGASIHAHGVDHGLRPEASSELDVAERLARELGVAFTRSCAAVGSGGNLQARARDARYRELRESANRLGGALVATAHHADDRAETVLLRLLRGAGPRGLAVFPARSGDLLRPLIRVRKSDVILHLQRHALPFCEDPSNHDRRYLRVRVRAELLPLLESLSPRIVEHLNALADDLVSPEPPVVLDEVGRPIALGRPHVVALRRAVARGLTRARVRLPGGREVRIDPRTRIPVLIRAPKSRT